MKAKDTKMSDDEILAFMCKLKDNPKLLVLMIEIICKAEYQAGIKEVVEWVYHNLYLDAREIIKWEAKLKVWVKDDPELLKVCLSNWRRE